MRSLLLFSVLLTTCGAPPAPTPDSLVVGTFDSSKVRVLDGDTILVKGYPERFRLIGVDAEERFSSREQRAQADRDFETYRERKTKPRRHWKVTLPRSYATPFGEQTFEWLRTRLSSAPSIRIEWDRLDRRRDFFGRHLVHVFVEDGSDLTHVNSEMVREGWSAYFIKYGAPKRFQRDYQKARESARRERRGIWDASLPHYADYEARESWWAERADQVARFDRAARGISMLDDEALDEAQAHTGPVTLFGEIHGAWSDDWMRISHRKGMDVEIRCGASAPVRKQARAAFGFLECVSGSVKRDDEGTYFDCSDVHLGCPGQSSFARSP